jgi:hypothetical protein
MELVDPLIEIADASDQSLNLTISSCKVVAIPRVLDREQLVPHLDDVSHGRQASHSKLPFCVLNISTKLPDATHTGKFLLRK